MCNLDFWKKASSKRRRIYSIIVILVVAVVVTTIGVLVPVSAKDASAISNDLNQTVNSLQTNDALTPYIFGNNFMICLVMFLPIAGPIFGFYVLFNTGLAVGAIADTQGIHPTIIALFAEFVTPIFWLEFAAYSIAIAESIWLLRRITQRQGTREIGNTAFLVTICAIILLVSAFIETALISIA